MASLEGAGVKPSRISQKGFVEDEAIKGEGFQKLSPQDEKVDQAYKGAKNTATNWNKKLQKVIDVKEKQMKGVESKKSKINTKIESVNAKIEKKGIPGWCKPSDFKGRKKKLLQTKIDLSNKQEKYEKQGEEIRKHLEFMENKGEELKGIENYTELGDLLNELIKMKKEGKSIIDPALFVAAGTKGDKLLRANKKTEQLINQLSQDLKAFNNTPFAPRGKQSEDFTEKRNALKKTVKELSKNRKDITKSLREETKNIRIIARKFVERTGRKKIPTNKVQKQADELAGLLKTTDLTKFEEISTKEIAQEVSKDIGIPEPKEPDYTDVPSRPASRVSEETVQAKPEESHYSEVAPRAASSGPQGLEAESDYRSVHRVVEEAGLQGLAAQQIISEPDSEPAHTKQVFQKNEEVIGSLSKFVAAASVGGMARNIEKIGEGQFGVVKRLDGMATQRLKNCFTPTEKKFFQPEHVLKHVNERRKTLSNWCQHVKVGQTLSKKLQLDGENPIEQKHIDQLSFREKKSLENLILVNELSLENSAELASLLGDGLMTLYVDLTSDRLTETLQLLDAKDPNVRLMDRKQQVLDFLTPKLKGQTPDEMRKTLGNWLQLPREESELEQLLDLVDFANRATNLDIVLKEPKLEGLDKDQSAQVLKDFAEEQQICQHLATRKSPALCTGQAVLVGDKPYIALPLCEEGSLKDFTVEESEEAEGSEALSDDELVNISKDIAEGLSVMHDEGYVHLDMAPRNVLLYRNEQGDRRAKVTDFGLTQGFDRTTGETEVTKTTLPLKWLAPETIEHREASPASDVWSFGITIRQMLMKEREPYPEFSKDEAAIGVKSQALSPEFTQEELQQFEKEPVKRQLAEIVNTCFAFSPEDRPSCHALSARIADILR